VARRITGGQPRALTGTPVVPGFPRPVQGLTHRIEHLLPLLDAGVLSPAEEIIRITLEWEEELAEEYPYVVLRGRPTHSTQDSPHVTSFETHLRGEWNMSDDWGMQQSAFISYNTTFGFHIF